jgi:hypothetical protein
MISLFYDISALRVKMPHFSDLLLSWTPLYSNASSVDKVTEFLSRNLALHHNSPFLLMKFILIWIFELPLINKNINI